MVKQIVKYDSIASLFQKVLLTRRRVSLYRVFYHYAISSALQNNEQYEPHHEKTNVLVSDLVLHKPGCTATEDGKMLENSDLESRGIVSYLCSENKGADQLRGYREADLRLCFRICKTFVFS